VRRMGRSPGTSDGTARESGQSVLPPCCLDCPPLPPLPTAENITDEAQERPEVKQ
jgi:hypothetical protein